MPKYSAQYLILKYHHFKFFPPANYSKVISKCKFCKIIGPYRLRHTVIVISVINKTARESDYHRWHDMLHGRHANPETALLWSDCFTWGLLSQWHASGLVFVPGTFSQPVIGWPPLL